MEAESPWTTEAIEATAARPFEEDSIFSRASGRWQDP
jgi:hypothetical protein